MTKASKARNVSQPRIKVSRSMLRAASRAGKPVGLMHQCSCGKLWENHLKKDGEVQKRYADENLHHIVGRKSPAELERFLKYKLRSDAIRAGKQKAVCHRRFRPASIHFVDGEYKPYEVTR